MKSLVPDKGTVYATFGLLAIFSCIAAVYPHTYPFQLADKPYDAAMIGNIAWMLVAARHTRHG